jgi:hypothetical protein
MNTDLVQLVDDFNATVTAEFWWYFPALLTDTKRVGTVKPLSCSGRSCSSYFLPGSMMTVLLNESQTLPNDSSYPDTTTFIVNDAPGYQLDFYPIDTETDPPMTLDDCRVYGMTYMALNICLKQVGDTIMSGTSSFLKTYKSLEFMSGRSRKPL